MSAFDAWLLPAAVTPLRTREAGGLRIAELDERGAAALLASLRAAREALLARTAADRARVLGRAGGRFLDRNDPLRQEAEQRVHADASLSLEMARYVIDGMARDWTEARLLELLRAELPDPDALDAFVAGPSGTRQRAFGPALSLHVGSGTVPGVSATSLLRALLIGSPALLKPGGGDVVLPVLLGRAIAEEDAELARALAIVYWPRDEGGALETAALAAADAVVVYGGDASVRSIRERLPVTTRLVAYHHRVSVAVIGREALSPDASEKTCDALALAVATFDQRGCVSPHLAFVEEGGHSSPADFAERLGRAFARVEHGLPSGPPDPSGASAVHQLRRTAELRAAAGESVRVHADQHASWTVLLEPATRPELSCLGRTLRVHPVADAGHVPALLAPWGPHLQTVGVAGLGERAETLAAALGAAGASRVCALEDVAFPPPWWHHDGQGPLRALLRWVDLEG